MMDQAALNGILNYNKCCRNPTTNVERELLASDPFCVAQIYILADYTRGLFCYTKGRKVKYPLLSATQQINVKGTT